MLSWSVKEKAFSPPLLPAHTLNENDLCDNVREAYKWHVEAVRLTSSLNVPLPITFLCDSGEKMK